MTEYFTNLIIFFVEMDIFFPFPFFSFVDCSYKLADWRAERLEAQNAYIVSSYRSEHGSVHRTNGCGRGGAGDDSGEPNVRVLFFSFDI